MLWLVGAGAAAQTTGTEAGSAAGGSVLNPAGAARIETGDGDTTDQSSPTAAPNGRGNQNGRGIATGDGRNRLLPTRQGTTGTRPSPDTAPTDAAATSQAETDALRLLDLLRDAEVRTALLAAIGRLNRAEGDTTAEPEAAEDAAARAEGDVSAAPRFDDTDAAPAPDEPRRTLGRQIAETTTDFAVDLFGELEEFWNGLAATQRRLSGFARADLALIASIAQTIAVTVLTTVASFLLLRLFVLPVRRRIGDRIQEQGMTLTALLFALYIVIDALTILLAWASGYAIAFFARGQVGGIDIYIVLFLNAFLGVETVKLVFRAILSPAERRLRPLPLSDVGARYWSIWASVLITVLGYGQLLIVPLVNEVVNIFTGRATAVLIYAAVLIATTVLVIVHRRDAPRYFEAQAEAQDGDVTMRVLAAVSRYAWLAIMAYLVTLTVIAIENQGNVGQIIRETIDVIAVVLVGGVVATALNRAGRHGVKVPSAIDATLPMLERRLNTFVPAFLRAMRFLILLAVLSVSLQILGFFDFQAWLDSAVGGDAAGRLISVVIMILAAFVIWLALSSWIDYRLRPVGYRLATAREQTLLTLLRNAGTIAIVVITLMFSLSELGIDIAPLIASAGVLGLAIGFGAQKMVQDIITGIFIQFENAINVGDVITVGGTTGTVEKLTIRSVSLRDLEGVFHVIPFSSVDMVSNYMRGFAYHVADLGIAYREDIDEAKALMERCFAEMRQDPDWRFKIASDFEWFGVQSLGDSAVVLRGRIKTTPGQQWGVGRQYNERLKKACDEAGIEIPFPHMTIWMGEGKDGAAPALRLRGDGAAPTQPSDPDSHARLGGDTPPSAPKRSVAPTQDEPLEET